MKARIAALAIVIIILAVIGVKYLLPSPTFTYQECDKSADPVSDFDRITDATWSGSDLVIKGTSLEVCGKGRVGEYTSSESDINLYVNGSSHSAEAFCVCSDKIKFSLRNLAKKDYSIKYYGDAVLSDWIYISQDGRVTYENCSNYPAERMDSCLLTKALTQPRQEGCENLTGIDQSICYGRNSCGSLPEGLKPDIKEICYTRYATLCNNLSASEQAQCLTKLTG